MFIRSIEENKLKLSNVYSLLYLKEEENIIIQAQIINRKNFHYFIKYQKQIKQWRGAWREKKQIDFDSMNILPLRLSSHRFANFNRCILKLRTNHEGKFLQKSGIQLNSYEQIQGRDVLCDSYKYCSLLFKEDPEENFDEAKKIFGIDIKGEIQKKVVANFSRFVTEYYYFTSATHRDLGLPPPLDCEIYTGLYAIKGKVLLKVHQLMMKGKNPLGATIIHNNYLLFVTNKCAGIVTSHSSEEKNEDDRMMFEHYPRKNEKTIYKFNLYYLKEVIKKQMVDTRTALELDFCNGRSILLNFAFEETREKFCIGLNKLRELQYCPQLKYDPTLDPIKIIEKIKLTEEWLNWRISNFDYLMALNMFSSRSFYNFSQYPVFPWVIANYFNTSINLPLQDKATYRDLTRNLGMQGDARRAEDSKERFLQPDYFGQGNYHFGSHYSNPGIIYQFMMRIYPFFEAYIKFFNGLDDPNRMFHSLAESYGSALKDSADLRELIPEFYCLPEMFINRECLKFGQREDDKAKVHDILLPGYAQKQRIYLRRNYARSVRV